MSHKINEVSTSTSTNLLRVTVGTVILDSTHARVYLLKRQLGVPFEGQLCLPGGTVEVTDETLSATAQREIFHGIKLNLNVTQFLTWFLYKEWVFAVFVTRLQSTDMDQKLSDAGGQWYTWESLDIEQIKSSLAPNVYEACQEARIWSQSIRKDNVIKTIPKALMDARTALVNNFRENDALSGGWNHFFYESEPGSIGTSDGLRALLATGYPAFSNEVQKARTFLKICQNTDDGGWSTIALSLLKPDKLQSITESTSSCLLALLQAGENPNEPCMVKGFNWLHRNQCSDGGWNLTAEFKRSRVLPTTLALEALYLIGDTGKEYRKGLEWLVNAQHSNGMWDIYSYRNVQDQEGSCAHVARALICVSRHAHEYGDVIHKGLKWLAERYETGKGLQNWPGVTEIEFFKRPEVIGINWIHFAAPWCLKALVKNGLWLETSIVGETIQHILENQDSRGIWQPPGLPRVPTWALNDCVSALELVSSHSIYHLETTINMAISNQVNKKLDRLVVYLNSVIQKPSSRKLTSQHHLWQKVWIHSVWLGWVLFIIVLLWSLDILTKLWDWGTALPLDNVWIQVLLGIVVAIIAALIFKVPKYLKKLFLRRK